MNNVKMCPKCGGEMVRGTNENLVRNFSCTRGEPKPEDVQIVKVHSSYCGSCGYMEFYRALVAEEKQNPSLIEEADEASKLHWKEKKE
jgi:predicted nucleic-acid-binding Zn-ribbon protein